jgi:hypothetical protein
MWLRLLLTTYTLCKPLVDFLRHALGEIVTVTCFLELLCHGLGTNSVEISFSGRLGLSQKRLRITLIYLLLHGLYYTESFSHSAWVGIPQLQMPELALLKNKSRSQSQSYVTTGGLSVCLGVKFTLELVIRYYFLSEGCCLVSVGRPLWRDVGSVSCQSLSTVFSPLSNI